MVVLGKKDTIRVLYCVIVVVVESLYLPFPLPAHNLEPIIRTHSDSSLQPEASYRLIPTTVKYYMHLHLQYSTVSNLHCRKLNSRLIPLRLHVLPVKSDIEADTHKSDSHDRPWHHAEERKAHRRITHARPTATPTCQSASHV